MGRRLWLILGMMLLASPAAAMARAQGEGQKPTGQEGAPNISPGFPLPPPEDVKDPVPLGNLPEIGAEPQSQSKTAPSGRPAKRSPDPAVQRTDGADPPQGQSAASSAAAPAEPKPLPLREPSPSPPSTSGSVEARGMGGVSADRLPLGKQSVAVTVDVQAPPSLNLNQPATLRLVIRNTGACEAMNVQVHDELPEGLRYVDSQPKAYVAGESLLSWRFSVLPGGSEKVITIKVKPEKTGAYDHAATVTFQSGSKARTRVLRPRLKVDQVVSTPKVLKNQPVEFKVIVTNIGDGPARNVTLQAKLSPGLRHGSGEHGDNGLIAEIPELAPDQHEELETLVADAIQGGEQTCTVTATSPDVILVSAEDKAEAENTKTVTVVQPELKLTLTGPDKRYTDTVAPYEITVENPGTAPARRVRIVATLPVSGRLVVVPRNAEYDSTTRRLQWALETLEAGGKPMTFGFEVRMGGVGFYEVTAEARGEGALHATARKSTDVIGMADVDLVVSERQRVVDVGGKTTFQIRLRNYGTKEATRLQVTAKLSKNLDVTEYSGPTDQEAQFSKADGAVVFPLIEKLGPGKEILLGVTVKVVGEEPKLATCRVQVLHDDLTEPFEDMAGIKVMPSHR